MPNYLRNYYLKHLLRREVTELFLTVSVKFFAISMIAIFEPIYFYTLGFSLQQILLFYFLVYVGYFFVAPLGGKFAVRLGFEHSIAYAFGVIFAILLSYYLIPSYPIMFWGVIPLIVLYKSLFWVSYHANFSHYGDKKSFGKEVGFISSVLSLTTIVGPLVGGYVLGWFGYPVLFVIVSLLLLVALLPMFSTREQFVKGSFSYWASMKYFFSKTQRRVVLSMLGLSTEITDGVVWPIFMFVIVESFANLGIVSAIGSVAATAIVLFMGRIADIRRKDHLMRVLAPFFAIGQLVRLFVAMPLPVALANMYSKTVRSAFDVLFVSSRYDVARRSGSVRTAVFVEQAYSITKVLLVGVVLLISFLWPALNLFAVSFIVSAVLVLSFLFIRR